MIEQCDPPACFRIVGHRGPCGRAVCGAWMPLTLERCGRNPGHGYDHRSRYALDNQRAARLRKVAS